VPVLGSLIPGSTIILSLSALIATGDLNLTAVLASAMIGAALGDGTAFWLGRDKPRLVYGLWPLNKYPDVIKRSERFFRDHGSIAVFFARFVPPVRAFVPIIAGAMQMPPQRFFMFNLPAIALWAPAHVIPGMLAGTVYARAGVVAEQMVLPVIAGAIAVAALIWVFRRMRQS
jgi:membrane-associated protein